MPVPPAVMLAAAAPAPGASYPFRPPSATAGVSGVPGLTPQGTAAGGVGAADFAETLRAQTAALQHLVAQKGRASASNQDDCSDEEIGSFKGARGALTMERHRRTVAKHPERVIKQVRDARNAALTGPAHQDGVSNTYRGYFSAEVPFGKARTAAYLVFGLCEVADLLEAGKTDAAQPPSSCSWRPRSRRLSTTGTGRRRGF